MSYYFIFGIIIIFAVFVISLILKRVKRIPYVEKKAYLDEKKLSADQLDIYKEMGNPIDIKTQESIKVEDSIIMWIYPESIIKFSYSGKLLKKM